MTEEMTVEQLKFDLMRAMRGYLIPPLCDTPSTPNAIAASVDAVLANGFQCGLLTQHYKCSVETHIINNDNHPVYQRENPNTVDIIFTDQKGRAVSYLDFSGGER